jgi:hypothetical protein
MNRPHRKPFTGHPQLDADVRAKDDADYIRRLEQYATLLEEELAFYKMVSESMAKDLEDMTNDLEELQNG